MFRQTNFTYRLADAGQILMGGQQYHAAPLRMLFKRLINSATPCLSIAVSGSSRIHSGAALSHSRANATRRCCPADSCATGRSS